MFDVEYERYFNGAKFIHFLLGPATVALAIPIYLNWQIVMAERRAIITTVMLGAVFAILITFGLAHLLGLDQATIRSLLPPAASTAPIAMGISEVIGGISIFNSHHHHRHRGDRRCDWHLCSGSNADQGYGSAGFAFGLTSHGIGTARAMSRDRTAVFAAVAMGLSGM